MYYFVFLLQFGNNNNYMNMADANGALLVGDVEYTLLEDNLYISMDC